jgi:DNA polymerase
MANSRRELIPLGLDFESYYCSRLLPGESIAYTLNKLTTSQYVLDTRFEAIGVGLGLGAAVPVWFSGSHSYLKRVLERIPWDRTLLIAHNAIFDGAVLEWIFGFKPAKYFCTMMGSRPYVAPFTGRMSLGSVGKFLNLGEKGDEVVRADGKHRRDFSPAELAEYGKYCCNDVVLTCRTYEQLVQWLPEDEQDLIDLTIKKFTRPTLKLDRAALQQRQTDIVAEREQLRQDLVALFDSQKLLEGVEEIEKPAAVETVMRSRVQFATVLQSQGIKIPMKKSKANGKDTFAMSKTDAEFMDLLTHDNEVVRELVAARLKLSSNMEATRLERFDEIAALDVGGDTLLPVPLLYYGAHPGRFSGLDKINLQNLPRIKFLADGKTPDPDSGWLRRSIVAPDGCVIVAGDLSQIEARIVATLAGCYDLVRQFASKQDTYGIFATRVYGRPIDKKKDPVERFVGKTCILGLGYGMGWAKFLLQMLLAKVKGMTPEQAKRIVYLYRETYKEIPQLWANLEDYLKKCVDPQAMFTYGPLTFLHERIVLPNGMPLIYPGLKGNGEQLEFTSKRAKDEGSSNKLWGGVITENVVQALARIVISRAELRLARAGLRAALQVHDELVYCVPEQHAEKVKRAIEIAFKMPVDFLPRLPVDCEVGIGKTYAECK